MEAGGEEGVSGRAVARGAEGASPACLRAVAGGAAPLSGTARVGRDPAEELLVTRLA